ncbi:MAG: hypothetical protein IKZ27_04850, partial [Kiritimatiellae bacterium]|nr:hypothetical protein [Kiritimatiellia bacterium]
FNIPPPHLLGLNFRVVRVFCGFVHLYRSYGDDTKNGENRKFENLEKCEIKAILGDIGVKKQAVLRANSTYFALQCNLCSTSM